MQSNPQTSETPPQSHRRYGWFKVILLIMLIGLLSFAIYFVNLTKNIGEQLADGTYDLSTFAVDGQSHIEGSESAVISVADTHVVNFANDPAIGPLNAPITIVAFEDFQCPYCEAAFPAVKALLNKHGDKVRFIYRDFPISALHPDAQLAAEAGACANEQGQFWPYHDRLYQNQDHLSVDDLKRYATELNLEVDLFNDCLDTGKYSSEVQEDLQDGIDAGVTGTPTFFINGNVVSGVINEQGFDQIVEYFGN